MGLNTANYVKECLVDSGYMCIVANNNNNNNLTGSYLQLARPDNVIRLEHYSNYKQPLNDWWSHQCSSTCPVPKYFISHCTFDLVLNNRGHGSLESEVAR